MDSRRLRIVLLTAIFAVAVFLGGVPSAFAATIYSNYSTGNDSTGNGTSGNPYKTFNKAYTAASSGDTINLSGTFDWTNSDETGDAASTGYTIAKSLTIVGQSASTTIIQAAGSANTADRRVFTISSSANVTFQDLTIRYGYITSGSGAGINNTGGGSLTLRDVTITGDDGSGGLVSGGVFSGGVTTIDRCTFASNTGGYMSAFYLGGATTITNSTFYNNTGATYGEIYDNGYDLSVTNTLIASSSYLYVQGSPTIRFKNSILLGTPGSGAIYYYNWSGTVTDNGNNIVAGETGAGGSTGPYFVNGVNGTTKVANSTKLSDLNIATSLADNGSPNGVQTLALQNGSQAIDAGSGGYNGSVSVPAVDGRDLYRDATPDIGPYEYNASASQPSFSAPTTAASNVAVGSISQASTTISWTNGNGVARTVFMKEGTSGDASPVNNTTYTANTVLGSGSQIGSTGWYAVYNGNGSSVTVSNLSYMKNYRVHVVEYGGYAGGNEVYQTGGITATTTKSAYTGTTIYSNYTSGNDTTGAGTSGSPYKTFNKGYLATVDGDTLHLTGTFDWSNSDETGDAASSGYTIAKSITITGDNATSTIVQAASATTTSSRRVFTIGAGASTTIQNLTVRYGVGSDGAGIYVSANATTTLYGLDINNNLTSTSGYGGGINVTNASVYISNSSIHDNAGGFYGGGIYVNATGKQTTVTNSTLYYNYCQWLSNAIEGGGIYVAVGTTTVTNSTIVKNGNNAALSARQITYGGGISVASNASAQLAIKNSIVAQNIASTAGYENINKYASAILVNGGYNAVGKSTNFAGTTGDWVDSTNSGTFTLNTVGTTGALNLDTAAAANNSLVGTPTWAITTGSIAIDTGSAVANNGVAIPVLDQRGATRSGATDIGAFEYNGGGLTDSVPPSVSLTAPVASEATSSTMTLAATASDNVAVAGVTFYVDGTKQGSEITSAPYTTTFNTLATTTGSHSAFAVARDTSNNYATSTVVSFTVANPITISSPSVSTTTTTATITWTTNRSATSTISYGTSMSYGSATSSAASVTSHSLTLTGLSSATTYHYQIGSGDAYGNYATSSDATFTTATVPDTTPPSVSLTAPVASEATSSTMTLAASASDNVAVAGVKFYINGVLQGSEVTSAPYTTTFDTTATSSGTYIAFAAARDTSNNYATSTSISFVITNSGPTPTLVTATPSSSGATITWTTAAAASSRVWFGLTSSYSTSTQEVNVLPRVTSHVTTLTGLPSCTRFHFAVTGRNSVLNAATSSDATFTTTGCTGNASVSATGDGYIATASGGTVSENTITLTVPVSFTGTSTGATFQASQLDRSIFLGAAGSPTGLSAAGSAVYTLKALTDATTTLPTFSQPITVTLSYSASDVSGLDVSSLWIYRYDGSTWHALNGCMVDTSAKTVTCTTSNFSDFAIFGDPSPSSSPSTASSGAGLPWCSGPSAPGWNSALADGGCGEIVATAPGASPIPASTGTNENTTSATVFTRMLHANMQGSDVRTLQQFLNSHGFTLAARGLGSPGDETDYFGPLTWNALVKFQEAHAAEVLAPVGLTKGSGIFGSSTVQFVNAMLAAGE